MTKADFNFPFGRNPGSYSVYKMRGVERLIIRAKAGPSKKQIATAPQFAFMRQNMSEFGGADGNGSEFGVRGSESLPSG